MRQLVFSCVNCDNELVYHHLTINLIIEIDLIQAIIPDNSIILSFCYFPQ